MRGARNWAHVCMHSVKAVLSDLGKILKMQYHQNVPQHTIEGHMALDLYYCNATQVWIACEGARWLHRLSMSDCLHMWVT
jgi:hypothetical protein